jgi:hypothetical protein
MRTFYSMVEKIGKSSQFIYEFLTTKLLLKKFLLFREFKLKWSVKIMIENRTWKTLDPKSFSLFLLFSLNIYELIENYSTWVAFLRIVGVFINSVFFMKNHHRFLMDLEYSFYKEKHSLQSKFTLLKSKFFPAKIPFSKIQKKNLAGKNLLCKGSDTTKFSNPPNIL